MYSTVGLHSSVHNVQLHVHCDCPIITLTGYYVMYNVMVHKCKDSIHENTNADGGTNTVIHGSTYIRWLYHGSKTLPPSCTCSSKAE